MGDAIAWLEAWYASNCDGRWENASGVRIETLDNPGWELVVDLEGTSLEGERFAPLKVDRSDTDWFSCSVQDGRFIGAGGALNLRDLIDIFRTWVETVERIRK